MAATEEAASGRAAAAAAHSASTRAASAACANVMVVEEARRAMFVWVVEAGRGGEDAARADSWCGATWSVCVF